MNFPTPDSKWYMAGSQRTGEYIVVAMNSKGRIGYRVLNGGEMIRVRLEPSENEFQLMYGIQKEIENWNKAPMDDGFCRFSVVVDPTIIKLALSDGLRALGIVGDEDDFEANDDAPEWATDLIDSPVDGPTDNPLVNATPTESGTGTDNDVLSAIVSLMGEVTKLVAKLASK